MAKKTDTKTEELNAGALKTKITALEKKVEKLEKENALLQADLDEFTKEPEVKPVCYGG